VRYYRHHGVLFGISLKNEAHAQLNCVWVFFAIAKILPMLIGVNSKSKEKNYE